MKKHAISTISISRLQTLIAKVLGAGLIASIFATTAHADINRARAFLEQGRAQEAITELDGDINLDRNNAEARFLKGVALQALKKNDAAIEIYSGLVNDFPELPEPWNNLAVLWADKQEFDKAEEALRAAIKTNQSYATAHENLGDIYAQRASIAYTDALSLEPSNRSSVEIKLSMIDNILLPPESRRPMNAQVAPVTPQATRPQQATSRPATATPTRVDPVASNPSPASSGNVDNTVIRDAVMSWADAWSSRNVDAYLNHYDNSFRPIGGASRASWAKYRSERLKAPSFIIVNINDLRISNNADGTIEASFLQDYQSDGYQDVVRKTLRMINTSSGWKIVKENSQAV